ncbi:MAG: isoaspartyl peptidase/L-asparaginase [Anaeromyxobacter sp.]
MTFPVLVLAVIASASPEPAPQRGPAVVVHGGVGSARVRMDATGPAAARGLALLRDGRPALEGAIASVVALEDDCRFNAGTGANIRMDGKTVQMDAAVMDGATGGFGAVAAIERVKNPVLVARRVMETPHVLVVGDGATRLARLFGFADHDPRCKDSLEKLERVRRILLGKETGPALGAWKRFDWRRFWNFPGPLPEELKAAVGTPDTVGAVARDARGHFAAAISSGGTTITFYGRVGDVPIAGAGVWAGPAGAVACTGQGEEIIRRAVARAVYEDLARGAEPQDAVDRALAAFPADVDLGVIAVGPRGEGGGANYSAERQAFGGPFRDNMAWSAAR